MFPINIFLIDNNHYFDSFEKKDNNEIAYINRFKGSGMNWAIKSDSIIAGSRFAIAVPEVVIIADGVCNFLLMPREKYPLERSSI